MKRIKSVEAVAVALSLLLAGGATGLNAQDAARSANDGVYSDAQAERGRVAYEAHCSICHGGSLAGADVNPALAGSPFQSKWTGQSVGDIVQRAKTTMPLDDPGSLGTATITDITAYILKTNGYPAGAADLPREGAVQAAIRLDPPKQ